MITDRQIYDKEAESIVLGSIIGNSHAWEECRDMLTEDCFYLPMHCDVFRCIKEIDGNGDDINIISVKTKMDRESVNYDLQEYMKMAGCFAPDIKSFVMRLDDLRKRRALWVLGNRMIVDSVMESEDVDDVVQYASKELADLGLHEQVQFKSLGQVIYELREQVKRNMSGDANRNGSPTGFSEYDKMGGGFQPGDLVIVAGETSQGKSSLAVCMASNTAREGIPVAIYSLEMTSHQLAARLVAIESGVSSSDIIYKALDDTRWAAFDRGVTKLLDLPIYIDETSTSNLTNILASIRSMVKRYGIRGAVVDYLQILSVNSRSNENAEQLMGNAARQLKNIAKELGIWIMALSQLSRDKEHPEPSLARLRQSGQIAEAADVVMLIYRPEVYGRFYGGEFKDARVNGTALIDVAKGRNIGLKKFLVGFDAATTHFYELDGSGVPGTPTESEPIPF